MNRLRCYTPNISKLSAPALSQWERVPGGRVRENLPGARFLVPYR